MMRKAIARSVAAVLAAIILIGTPTPASAFWSASSTAGSQGSVSVATIPRGATPVATVATQNDITVSWAATTLSTTTPVTGYLVTRLTTAGVAQTTLAGCAGIVPGTTCTETDVPDGLWIYRITPRFGTNWEGAQSADSTAVRSDATPPVNNLSRGSITGNSVAADPTIFYRGSVAGSFKITNTVTDAGSGPASSTTALTGVSTGWTHSPSTVTTPAGGPYVANTFSWAAGTTTQPTITVTAADASGNTAITSVPLVLDNAGPTGGAISYPNGAQISTTVTVTTQPIADAGAGLTPGGTRTLQRAIAPLDADTCGTFGSFALQVTNPAAAQAVSVTAANCYRFRYVFTDALGNQTITTSSNIVRVRQQYQTVIQNTTGLVDYWRLGDTGTTAADISGANNPGTYFGTPARSQAGAIVGDTNTAVAFDGVDDYVQVTRGISTDFSIEFWFKSTQGLGTGNYQWWQGAGLVDAESPGAANDFGITLSADGRIAAGVGNPDQTAFSTAGYNNGAWHHVVMTRTAATGAVQLYVDGALNGTATGTTAALTASTSINFGRLATAGNYFQGSLDEVAIYGSVLPAATINTHYRSGF